MEKCGFLPCILLFFTFTSEVSPLQCYKCLTSENRNCPDTSSIVDCKANTSSTKPTTTKEKVQIDASDYLELDGSEFGGPELIEIEDNKTNSSEEAVADKTDSVQYVCIKNSFFINDWATTVTEDVETKKRMIKPRVQYTCGRVAKGHEGKCTKSNSLQSLKTLCTCTTDLCNGSGNLFIRRRSIDNFVIMITLFFLHFTSRL